MDDAQDVTCDVCPSNLRWAILSSCVTAHACRGRIRDQRVHATSAVRKNDGGERAALKTPMLSRCDRAMSNLDGASHHHQSLAGLGQRVEG